MYEKSIKLCDLLIFYRVAFYLISLIKSARIQAIDLLHRTINLVRNAGLARPLVYYTDPLCINVVEFPGAG